jgi:hypothetical protein
MKKVTADDFGSISDESWPVCPVVVKIHYFTYGVREVSCEKYTLVLGVVL